MRSDRRDRGTILLFYPSYEGAGLYHWFPFPYLYMAPFLEQAGFRVVIVDARVQPDWRSLVEGYAGEALCFGTTAMTNSDISCSLEAVSVAKKASPAIPVVWGGPHAQALPEQTLAADGIDVVVPGPGEKTMVELAEAFLAGRPLDDIKGVLFKKGATVTRTPAAPVPAFDYPVFPAYHLLNIENFRSPNNIVSMFSARGCPHRCSFCTTGEKGFSERSLEQVRREIGFLTGELGFKNLFFQDGTFFVKKERVISIAQLILETGLPVQWKAKARVDSLLRFSRDEMLLLKRSGLVSLFFGIESGSEKVLRNMRKNTRPEFAEKSAAICAEFGIEFYVSFMFATPFETTADLKATIANIENLKKINPKTVVQNCIYIPLPATTMFDQACACGFKPPARLEDWANPCISSCFEERKDVNWLPSDVLHRYIELYNGYFGQYKHLWQKERDGEYRPNFSGENKKVSS